MQRCLEAMARQDFPHNRFEVLVVDDGGDPPLDELVHRFHDRLDVHLLRQRNAGPSAARNHGARHARGRFLAFTDDDCEVGVDWLRRFAERFNANPDQLLGGQTVNILRDNLCSSASQLILDVVYDHYNANPEHARFFASQNIALPASRYRQLGGFDTRFHTSEDRDFCDRWAHAGLPLVFVREAVMFHSHPLSFRRFFRQHFHYGRGAHRFHQTRTYRQGGDFEIEGSFYAKCFLRPFTHEKGMRGLQLLALLGVWQAANTAGFFHRALQQYLERPRDDRPKSATGSLNAMIRSPRAKRKHPHEAAA
jgi:glycosyltransferase involved in cell wall biosynthesis